MEEQNVTPQASINPTTTQTAVPGAVIAFVFGIIAICTFWLGVYFVVPGLIPLIFGIIGWMKGKKAEKIYAENPANYVKFHATFAKIGKILGLIGWILSILFMLIFLIMIVFVGANFMH